MANENETPAANQAPDVRRANTDAMGAATLDFGGNEGFGVRARLNADGSALGTTVGGGADAEGVLRYDGKNWFRVMGGISGNPDGMYSMAAPSVVHQIPKIDDALISSGKAYFIGGDTSNLLAYDSDDGGTYVFNASAEGHRLTRYDRSNHDAMAAFANLIRISENRNHVASASGGVFNGEAAGAGSLSTKGQLGHEHALTYEAGISGLVNAADVKPDYQLNTAAKASMLLNSNPDTHYNTLLELGGAMSTQRLDSVKDFGVRGNAGLIQKENDIINQALRGGFAYSSSGTLNTDMAARMRQFGIEYEHRWAGVKMPLVGTDPRFAIGVQRVELKVPGDLDMGVIRVPVSVTSQLNQAVQVSAAIGPEFKDKGGVGLYAQIAMQLGFPVGKPSAFYSELSSDMKLKRAVLDWAKEKNFDTIKVQQADYDQLAQWRADEGELKRLKTQLAKLPPEGVALVDVDANKKAAKKKRGDDKAEALPDRKLLEARIAELEPEMAKMYAVRDELVKRAKEKALAEAASQPVAVAKAEEKDAITGRPMHGTRVASGTGTAPRVPAAGIGGNAPGADHTLVTDASGKLIPKSARTAHIDGDSVPPKKDNVTADTQTAQRDANGNPVNAVNTPANATRTAADSATQRDANGNPVNAVNTPANATRTAADSATQRDAATDGSRMRYDLITGRPIGRVATDSSTTARDAGSDQQKNGDPANAVPAAREKSRGLWTRFRDFLEGDTSDPKKNALIEQHKNNPLDREQHKPTYIKRRGKVPPKTPPVKPPGEGGTIDGDFFSLVPSLRATGNDWGVYNATLEQAAPTVEIAASAPQKAALPEDKAKNSGIA